MFGKFGLQASQTLNIIVGRMGEPSIPKVAVVGAAVLFGRRTVAHHYYSWQGRGWFRLTILPAVSSYIRRSSRKPTLLSDNWRRWKLR